MRDYTFPTILAVAILAIILLAMWWGWRARRRRDVASGAYPVPEHTGVPVVDADALYVATTKHEQPLERLALPGLGFRGRARLLVEAEGLRIEIPGEPFTWIPAAALRGVGPATYTIDRVVERDGLVCVSWQLDGTDAVADSYLRVIEPADREKVLGALSEILAQRAPRADTESEA